MSVSMFMNMGPTIVGESTDKVQGPQGDIDVLTWSWGMSSTGSTHSGGGGGAGKASFQDLTFTKYVDNASAALMMALTTGKHVPKAKLLVRRAGGAGQVSYITIGLGDSLVTSITAGGGGGDDRFIETVTLNSAQVKYTYTPLKSDGSVGGNKLFTWNIAENNSNVPVSLG